MPCLVAGSMLRQFRTIAPTTMRWTARREELRAHSQYDCTTERDDRLWTDVPETVPPSCCLQQDYVNVVSTIFPKVNNSFLKNNISGSSCKSQNFDWSMLRCCCVLFVVLLLGCCCVLL